MTWRIYGLSLLACVIMSGCATIHDSLPIARAGGTASVSTLRELPADRYLPELSAVVPGSSYVMVQAGGGSIFLGPILGTISIMAHTQALAERYKGQYFDTDPILMAQTALSRIPAANAGGNAAYVVRPFAFVQRCYDEKFRISLVYHVESAGSAERWIGRYTYHLPSAIPVSEFGNPSADQLAKFAAEMSQGAEMLAGLLDRDLKGELPATGKKVRFGTLHIIGNKMGGLGLYTMPEEMHFRDAQLIEETDTYVTVRIRANMHAPPLFGGMAFGVHRVDKRLVHTLTPM